jgi:DNA polymerase I-like protein with 3'-5' exonuclease and polymerase domains
MEKLIVLRSNKEVLDLIEMMKDKDYIAFDSETTGVHKEAHIIGYSVSWDVDTGYYIVLREWDKEKQVLNVLETIDTAKTFMEALKSKNLIMHNAVFDAAMVQNNFGVQLIQSVHTDTLILGHLLNENRRNGLKELAISIFADDSNAEQLIMKESIHANGGQITKALYELYKADSVLIGRYGAKDTILTLKLFYHFVPILFEEGLDKFFYEDESMPLLRRTTYDLNTVGLKVNPTTLEDLKGSLEAEALEAKSFVYKEIDRHIKSRYPGTSKPKTFNIGSSQQLGWLLFDQMAEDWQTLTDEGKIVCRFLGLKLPYTGPARRDFIAACKIASGCIYQPEAYNHKTKKMAKAKFVKEPFKYVQVTKIVLNKLASKHKWVDKLLLFQKNMKLLSTYVEGIKSKLEYNVIYPSFLQHGTTSGRYSSRSPNFQNLPRDDKRIKEAIISRPGKSFVGADYSQLEPRVFASFSKDERLLASFKSGEDFYSVIGSEVFDKVGFPLEKDSKGSFAKTFPELRNIAKVIALSSAYGTTAPKMAIAIGKSIQEAQYVIDDYFEKFPKVQELMIAAHNEAMDTGVVKNLFGRPRRMPEALSIRATYGKIDHASLPYEARNVLNLAINHTIQSTGASIVNRASILFYQLIDEAKISNANIVLQVHDELIIECNDEDAEQVAEILKVAMENAVTLPGVDLITQPVIGKTLAELK